MKRKPKTKVRVLKKGRATFLKVLKEGTYYVHFFDLPNGRALQVIDENLGKYGAISYNHTMGLGDVFATKADAVRFLSLAAKEGFENVILKPRKIEILNADGTRAEVLDKGFFSKLKTFFGGK
jgi:hypothetical protein